MDTEELDSLLALALGVAQQAGDMLRHGVDEARASVDTKSSATDMVTVLDQRSEAFIIDRITLARPHDGLVGEEGGDIEGSSGVRWIVDPLDGTTNYLYGYPGWNVSIGAEFDGEPIVGAIAVPSQGELYAAARGRGATCNGRPLHRVDPPPLATSLVGTGFGYDPDIRRMQAERLVTLLPRVRDIRRGGAAAADLAFLAAGRLDLYYEWGLNPWDRCAGQVVAGEAGMRVEVAATAANGRTLTVGAHPDRRDEWLALLADAGVVDAVEGA